MYIRKTQKIDSHSGKTYFAYHLVESTRTDKGPRQRILLYMGAEIALPEGDLKILAQRIDEIISGQRGFVPYSEEVEQLAQLYASQLIHRLSDVDTKQAESQPEAEFQTIDVHTIEQSEPRSVGAEHLLLQMANQLDLSKKLRELGLSEKEVALSLGTIIARAVHPASERATHSWLTQQSGMGELIDFDFQKASLDNLYRISDILLSHKSALESHLETTEQQVHGYKSTIALYDLTNTYMEGQAKANPKAKHGVSKEKRSDCPLLTLGLVINEHGFINRTSFLPGNASEPQTLEEMIKALDHSSSLFKPIIVLDAGISSDSNLQWLREHGYQYVVSARKDAPSLELESELVPVDDLRDMVKAALIKNDNTEEQWLYCESEAKAAVASQMKASFRSRFESDLQRLSEGIAKPKRRKKYTKVLEQIGRLKEKHKRISGCYEVRVQMSEDGETASSVTWEPIPEKLENKLTGRYFLRTNLLNSGPKELWSLYNTLRRVEDSFRFMKSSLGLRPVHHQKERRVDGHLWITVLAYHLIQNCLYQLSEQGLNYHWNTVLNWLSGRIRVTTQAKTQDGKTLHHRSTTKAEGNQNKLYKALGLTSQILKAKKTIV